MGIEKENIFKAMNDLEMYLKNRARSSEDPLLENVSPLIINILDKTKDYCDKTTLTKHEGYSLAVVLMHYYSTYDFLKSITLEYKKEKEILTEVNCCVCKEFIKISQNINTILKENDSVGSFINLMDMSLEKIDEINISKGVTSVLITLGTSGVIVENILSFALSIAQVGYSSDNKIITAACRAVLNSLDNIKAEINKEEVNVDMFKLTVEMYTNALCALEAKVNVAVLNLCLRIFSNYQDLIENLYDACLNFNSDSSETLDDLISEFDLQMDRIFQIGLFSLACSSMNKRSLDLRIVMLHLQFLEIELVPSFVSMTTNNARHRKKYANIFKKCWCTYVKKLRHTVHNIIEPEAYCKVIYEELKQSAEQMWNHISSGLLIQKNMVDPFLLYSNELGKMIKTSINSLNELKDNVLNKLGVIYNVMHELTVAKKNFLEKSSNYTTDEINLKLFKRCKVLVAAVKELWICLKGSSPEMFSDEDSIDVSNNGSDLEHTFITDNMLQSITEKSVQYIKNRRMDATIALAPVSNIYPNQNYSRNHTFMKTNLLHSNYSEYSMDSVLHDLKKSVIQVEKK